MPARVILHTSRAKFRTLSAPEWRRPKNGIPTIFKANENDITRSIPVQSCSEKKETKKKTSSLYEWIPKNLLDRHLLIRDIRHENEKKILKNKWRYESRFQIQHFFSIFLCIFFFLSAAVGLIYHKCCFVTPDALLFKYIHTEREKTCLIYAETIKEIRKSDMYVKIHLHYSSPEDRSICWSILGVYSFCVYSLLASKCRDRNQSM